jgi:hypothetical protein
MNPDLGLSQSLALVERMYVVEPDDQERHHGKPNE